MKNSRTILLFCAVMLTGSVASTAMGMKKPYKSYSSNIISKTEKKLSTIKAKLKTELSLVFKTQKVKDTLLQAQVKKLINEVDSKTEIVNQQKKKIAVLQEEKQNLLKNGNKDRKNLQEAIGLLKSELEVDHHKMDQLLKTTDLCPIF